MFGKKKESLDKKPDKGRERSRSGIPGLIDSTVTSTYEDILAIVEAKIELVKIELTEKIALVSALVLLLVFMLIGSAYLLTSFALLTGELLGHTWLGFLIVGLLFLGCFAFFTKAKPDALKNVIHKILLSANDYSK